MSWIHTAYLWALPFALTPILIYYLMRFRSLRVDWGATYVLERALQRMRRRLHWDQIILIALRTLAAALLVLAFARPISTLDKSATDSSTTHRVVLLDASFSMFAAHGDTTRWDHARDVLESLVADWGRGTVWSLYLIDDNPRWVVEGAAVGSPAEVAALLQTLEPGESEADLPAAFEAVRGKFTGDIELFVISDDQASSWAPLADAPPLDVARDFYWVRLAQPMGPNLAVTAVEPAAERILARHPTQVYVTVQHFGTEPVSQAQVELLVDGRFVTQQSVDLEPGLSSTLRFDFSIDDSGSHDVAARLAGDAMEVDNTLSAGIEVDPRRTVVILRDKEKTEPYQSSWATFETLNQMQDTSPAFILLGPLHLTLIEEPLQLGQLEGVDVVLLDGGATLTAPLAAVLEQFVKQGGGLILAADDQVDPALWNSLLQDADLLPARLRAINEEPFGSMQYNFITRTEFGDHVLQAFETEEAGSLSHGQFFTWFDLEPLEAAGGDRITVMSVFDDREPYAVRRKGELGSVILLASDLSGRGNTLIVREFFLPLVFRLINDAAAGAIYPRNVKRGEPIRLRLDPAAGIEAVTFDRPGAEPIALTPRQNNREQMIVEVPQGSPRSGPASMLVLERDGPRRVWFGVQGERIDADLTPLDPARTQALLQQHSIVQVDGWRTLQSILLDRRQGHDWHHWFILALLAMLVAEMLMQRRFTTPRK